MKSADSNDYVAFEELIAACEQLPESGRQEVIDRFFTERERITPFINDTFVYFVCRHPDAESVRVVGDFTGWDTEPLLLQRLEGTDLFYRQMSFPRDARLDYRFIIDDDEWIFDPGNPNQAPSGYGANSELAMPGFVQPVEIGSDPERMPTGSYEQYHVPSMIMDREFTVSVYLPAGYDELSKGYPSLYVFDGSEYISFAGLGAVIDHGVMDGYCDPMIAVCIDPVQRRQEYMANDNYRRFIVEELVPFIDGAYATSRQSRHRGLLGASLGGLTALNIAFHHPELFGNVAGQSSALLNDSTGLVDWIAEQPHLDLQVYLDVGTYENSGIYSSYPDDHRRLQEILQQKGYEYRLIRVHQGHAWGSWRSRLKEIVNYLFPPGCSRYQTGEAAS